MILQTLNYPLKVGTWSTINNELMLSDHDVPAYLHFTLINIQNLTGNVKLYKT